MSIGRISEFNVRSDNWKMYVERLEQYFVVNEIQNERQVPTLITVMGAECYELLVNLCTPDKPSSKTFKQLTDILEKYLQPKPSILSERYKFRHRKQCNNETISEYVAVLKKMSKTCEFGSWLEESLRDQLVCGISSETIRQRLFTEDRIDFGKAFTLAVSMEAAEKDAAAVEGRANASSGDIAACQAVAGTWRGGGGGGVGAGGGRARYPPARGRGAWRGQRAGSAGSQPRPATTTHNQQQQCRACGSNHDVSHCQFARYVCRVCNQQGHLRRACPYLAGQHKVDVAASTQEKDANSEDSDKAWQVTRALPLADIYVMKAEATTLRAAGSDPNNPKVLAVNLQKAQMVAMVVALVNARTNRMSTTEEDGKVNETEEIIKHKVYFLRPSLPYRLYGTLVGNERVSTDQTVEILLQEMSEKSSDNSQVHVSDELRTMFMSQKELQKDMLGHSLLLALTFMDLCVYKRKESIEKLLRRGD